MRVEMTPSPLCAPLTKKGVATGNVVIGEPQFSVVFEICPVRMFRIWRFIARLRFVTTNPSHNPNESLWPAPVTITK